MPNTGKTEPGSTAGQLDVQQQPSVQFSSSIPIKKRRFPIIQPVLPSPEEKASGSDANDSKNEQDSGIISDGKLSLNEVKNVVSPGNSALMVKKEQGTLSNIESGQSNAVILASKPQESKVRVSLGSTGDLKNERDSMMSVKHTESRILENSISAPTATVKQEIISARSEGAPRLELSMAPMNAELSLGTKETLFPVRSEKSDLTLLSLASSEKLALHDSNTTGTVGSGVDANRSNWDLNTTMDVWGGSVIGDTGGFSDPKLALDSGMVDLSLNKGKQVLDSSSSAQSGLHYKTDVSLGLKLAMPPSRDLVAHMGRPLSDKLVPTSLNPQVNLPQAWQSAVNGNSSVKSEPIDENSKHNPSIGSCRSSNMGLSKISSVKSELANNLSLGTPFPSSTSTEKSANHRSIKSEVVDQSQEGGKCKGSIQSKSVARVMQHQDSCASSSALPVPPMPDSCHSTLPTTSELARNSDLSNQSEHPVQRKESHDHNDITDDQFAGMVSKSVSQDDNQSTSSNVGNSNLEAPDKCKLAKTDEPAIEICQSGDVTGNDEKINIPAGILEEDPFGSDSESQEMDIDDENDGNKDYEEYEDGEVREPSKQNPVEEKAKNSELVGHNSANPQYAVSAGGRNINASTFEANDYVKKHQDEPSSDMIKDRVSIGYESNDKVTELGVDEKKSISNSSDKRIDTSGRHMIETSPGKMVSDNAPIKGSHEAIDKAIKEICSGENDSTLSKEEACFNDCDVKDSNNIGNKSRIINLSRTTTTVVPSPSKTRYIPNRLLSSRSGKERYSELDDADIQPRTDRDEFYIGGSKKFVKDRIHDRPLRNSFMRGKGRGSGRFGSTRREWDSDHDFISENYRGPTDYRTIRRKSNVDFDGSGYGVPQDGTGLGRGRRKGINDEFPSMRRQSLKTGDRDGTDSRGIQMLRRMPRNMNPNRCADEDCSDIIGVRHGNKFMRHLPDDMMDPVFNRQPVYEELDGQLVRGNRNYPIMHGNAYHRMGGSKSPVRSRSPGQWPSPRRRSPNGPPPENMFRMGRMRSPDPYRNEMITRRRGSPPFPTRYPNESRDMDSGREHGPHRPTNSHRRSSPGRSFPRNPRRGDVLDPQEMVEGNNEFINSPNKFHGEGSSDERRNFMRNSDERRNFMERRGPLIRSFRPMYGGENDDFQFHQNEGGPNRQFRFCQDMDNEFIERGNNIRREFEGGHVKHHQPMMQSRRIRNIDEQASMEGTWHEDGYTDNRMKRMRF